MTSSSSTVRLIDIIEAIELIRAELTGVTIQSFEPDRRKRWLVERGLEIISEASRHLPKAMKAQHPIIPWSKVAAMSSGMITSTWRTTCYGAWCMTICQPWKESAAKS
jgi:uncharacterized protein with HEPN domain